MLTVYALTPPGPSCSLEPNQVRFVELALVVKWAQLIDKFVAGHVGELDLLSGDVMEHKVQNRAIMYMALSGDMIVFCDRDDCIRVINNSTCLLMILSCCFV